MYYKTTFILLFTLLALCSAGCASSWTYVKNQRIKKTQTLKEFRFRVDSQASEIIFRESPFFLETPSSVQNDISRAIESLLNQGSPSTAPSIPVRYRIHVTSRNRNYIWTFIPCLFYFTFIGCPLYTDTYRITLSLEIQGQIYTHKFRHKSFVGYYYNLFQYLPFQKALVKGFKHIFKKVQKSPPPIGQSSLSSDSLLTLEDR